MHVIFNEKKMDVHTLFSKEQIQTRIQTIAKEINQSLGSKDPLVIVIVLNGAFIFAADLVRYLEMPTEIETIRLKSYEGTSSTGHIQMMTPLSGNVEGKNVLVIEDIVETGRTIHFLLNELNSKKAKSVKICTLLNKPDAHESPTHLDYIGFDIGKNFVIGYGLDLDGMYRNWPYIAELMPSK